MKKYLFMSLILSAAIATTTYAQNASGPAASATSQPTKESDAAMLQQAKDRIKPQMMEKTGLTDAQADKVIELNFEMRQTMGTLRDLNDADRSAKIAELKAAKEKKFTEFLTAEQIQSVKAFYEGMGKNAPKKTGN